VTFNPQPAAASGGPTNGAGLGLWNQYNRAVAVLSAQDSKATWTYASTTWQALDASNNNRITFVSGQAEDGILANAAVGVTFGSSASGGLGIGLDSTSTPFLVAQESVAAGEGTLSVVGATVPVLGQHYLQALQASNGTTTFNGTPASATNLTGQIANISAQLRY
jgi:hypothetical protein